MRGESHRPVAVGEVVGGYRLERLIGAGSTSRVYLGVHALLGRQAAVKVLSAELVSHEEVVARLLTEARVVNDIRHPNIVDVLDFVLTESPPRVALVMELIQGPTLRAVCERPISFAQAIGIAQQIAEAVGAAHASGVIHRDLKPDNLLLTADIPADPLRVPTVKVVDFGVAKLNRGGSRTATGMMLGTPAYMAPEQIAGRPPPSPATDVFALGEILFELLVGRRAYPASTIHETVRVKLRGELPALELGQVPARAELRAMIERCLALEPLARPGLSEVQAFLGALPRSPVPLERGAVPPPPASPAPPRPAPAPSRARYSIPRIAAEPTLAAEVGGAVEVPVPGSLDLVDQPTAAYVAGAVVVPLRASAAPGARADGWAPGAVSLSVTVEDSGPEAFDEAVTRALVGLEEPLLPGAVGESPASRPVSLPDPHETRLDRVPPRVAPAWANTEVSAPQGAQREDSGVTDPRLARRLEDEHARASALPELDPDDSLLGLLQPAGVASDPFLQGIREDGAAAPARPPPPLPDEPSLEVDPDPPAVAAAPLAPAAPPSLAETPRGLRPGPEPAPRLRSPPWRAMLAGALLSLALVLVVVAMVVTAFPRRSRPDAAGGGPQVRRVELRSDPSGATVADVATGEVLGTTPVDLVLDPRRSLRRLRLSAPGRAPREVDLPAAGGPVSVELPRP